MKKLILSMMALAAIATANAEELNATVENNNETTVEVAAPVDTVNANDSVAVANDSVNA